MRSKRVVKTYQSRVFMINYCCRMACFTLIELLVVIAIMAIMASMLLPTLTGARDASIRISCNNNLRQIYLGITMYTRDNYGFMPATNMLCCYSYLLQPYTNAPGKPNTSSNYVPSIALAKPTGIYYCPMTPSPANSSIFWDGSTPSPWSLPTYVQTVKYTNNNPIQGGWSLFSASSVMLPDRKIERIKGGSAIMCEVNYRGVINGVNYCSPWITPPRTGVVAHDAPAWNYHRNSANFLFVDGHTKGYFLRFERLFDSDWVPYE